MYSQRRLAATFLRVGHSSSKRSNGSCTRARLSYGPSSIAAAAATPRTSLHARTFTSTQRPQSSIQSTSPPTTNNDQSESGQDRNGNSGTDGKPWTTTKVLMLSGFTGFSMFGFGNIFGNDVATSSTKLPEKAPTYGTPVDMMKVDITNRF